MMSRTSPFSSIVTSCRRPEKAVLEKSRSTVRDVEVNLELEVAGRQWRDAALESDLGTASGYTAPLARHLDEGFGARRIRDDQTYHVVEVMFSLFSRKPKRASGLTRRILEVTGQREVAERWFRCWRACPPCRHRRAERAKLAVERQGADRALD